MATKHKADGLFYVTPTMLRDNNACSNARQAVYEHHSKTTGEYPIGDTKILITQALLVEVQQRAWGTISWFFAKVPGFEPLWTRHYEATYVNFSTEIMNALWLLAIKRGLISEDHPGKSRHRK